MALSPTSSHSGGVSTVAATDASIVVAGTAAAPTIATGTLDVIATQHAPAAAVAMNAKKITGLANGTAATDAAAFGQITAPAQVLLSTTTLGADGVFDVSGISQAYNDLLMILIVRATRVATAELLQMRLNNDSGANYDAENLNSTSTGASLSQTSARISTGLAAASATASFFSVLQVLLPGYTSTAWNQTILAYGSNPITSGASFNVELAGAVWKSTAAVTRVGFFGGTTANLLAGSVLRIYGVL